MTLTLIVLLFLLGILTGFYSGLIGTGGNIILIPALDILFVSYNIDGNESVKFIIAHSLFITVFLGLAVSYKQYKIGNFHLKEVLKIGIPGMISAYFISEIISAATWYDKFYFELIFLFLLILIAIRLLFLKPKNKAETSPNKEVQKSSAFIGLGAFTGCLTALSGLGGGVILIPFQTDVLNVAIKKASSISIGVILLMAMAVSLSYLFVEEAVTISQKLPYQIGYISPFLVLPILVGIFIASSFGVKVAQKTSPLKLRIILGFVVTFLCIKMILNLLVA